MMDDSSTGTPQMPISKPAWAGEVRVPREAKMSSIVILLLALNVGETGNVSFRTT